MPATLTIRHATAARPAPFPAFSDRSYRALSAGVATGEVPAPGFADTVLAVTGSTLAQCVYLSGLFAPPALCSGLGRCGLCRVRFLSEPPPVLEAEKSVLSHHDLESGWRLACRHAPEAGMHVLIPAMPVNADMQVQPAAGRQSRQMAVAVDLGTTSIHWQAVTSEAGAGTAGYSGVMANPQAGAGSDVISRLAFAASDEGAQTLRRLVVDALARIFRDAPGGVREACVAANPAMTAILLGHGTSGLARAPYSLAYRGNAMEHIPGLPAVYIPPLVSPFVGGDVSAGYASIALDPAGPRPDFPFLLADFGTNGECVLALSEHEALAASLPMGPALEGANLTFGSQAVPGAVTEYRLTPYGLEPVVMGGGTPSGIAATGYLSLLRALRAAGILNEDGLFSRPETAIPLAEAVRGDTADDPMREPRLRLPGKMFLLASDVEEILKVKAAFTVAFAGLLRETGLRAANLRAVHLSGSLGGNASAPALNDLGFLPPGLAGRIRLAGNTALAGARLFLDHQQARDQCARWAEHIHTLDLVSASNFGTVFTKHMVFSWPA